MTLPYRRSAWRAFGLLVVMLALAGRLAAGMVVADGDAGRSMASLLGAMIQCQSDSPASPLSGPHSPPHHDADHAIGTLAAVSDLPSPTLLPAPAVPLRRGMVALRLAAIPPARGPPPHPPGAALPRGPPFLT